MKHGSKMKVYDPYSNWNIRLTVLHKSEAGEFWRLQSNQKYKDIKHTHLENIPSGSHTQKLEDQDL